MDRGDPNLTGARDQAEDRGGAVGRHEVRCEIGWVERGESATVWVDVEVAETTRDGGLTLPPHPPGDAARRLSLPEWRLRGFGGPGNDHAWRQGYVWMRLGRHDLAHRWWDRADDPSIAPRIHASRGASLRELGLHRRAEVEDHAGLTAARREPAAGLRVGLVADAVGRGDRVAASQRLEEARAAVAALPAGRERDRQTIRLGWVAVEVRLLTADLDDDPPQLPTLTPDGEVVAPDHYAAGTVHHLAKGLLFAGVARSDRPALDRAARLAPPGLRWAVHLARADLGVGGALEQARAAWALIVPPGELAHEVAATPPARRLAG